MDNERQAFINELAAVVKKYGATFFYDWTYECLQLPDGKGEVSLEDIEAAIKIAKDDRDI